MTGYVLLLSPSRGLGGGIERYTETLESAFAAEGISCQRLDLRGSGARAHARLLARGRAVLRAGHGPARLVVAHRALLPVAALLARDRAARGVSVVCHGSDVWDSRWRPRRYLERRLMRGDGVRVVAVSNFTAGALMNDCRATVLPPALSREWLETLAGATAGSQQGQGIRLATAFRLGDWEKQGTASAGGRGDSARAPGRQPHRLRQRGSATRPAALGLRTPDGAPCGLASATASWPASSPRRTCSCWPRRPRCGRRAVGEGFGLVLLEAQAAGTPVIAPAYGGSREAYVEGVTGVAPGGRVSRSARQGPWTACSRIRPGWPEMGRPGRPVGPAGICPRTLFTARRPAGCCDVYLGDRCQALPRALSRPYSASGYRCADQPGCSARTPGRATSRTRASNG